MVGWRARLVGLLLVGALAYATWRVIGRTPYCLDIDVYRMGAQAWRDGHQLYGDVRFHTRLEGTSLPFTYPPIAAVLFTPFTWLSLRAATFVLTFISAALLVVSTAVVLTSLGVRPPVQPGPAWWRRGCLAAVMVTAAIWLNMEPIRSNFGYGQLNALLMTLVIADCLPERTRWPRGMLLGVAISVKLTPAVLLIYFVLRRDHRATLTALATFAATILAAFVLAPRDSWEYWTGTFVRTNRFRDIALNTNQNFLAVLTRMGLTGGLHFVVWMTACGAALALAVWAVRRVLGAGEPVLAVMCLALLGLLVSPVSWSHHWVWSLPVIVTLAVLGYRRKNPLLLGSAGAGLAVMCWSPIEILHEDSNLGEQLIGTAYVWWALAVIAAAGLTVAARVPAPALAAAPPRVTG